MFLGFGPNCGYNLPKDGSFLIVTASDTGGADFGPCMDFEANTIHTVGVDIEYDIDIGGVTSRKHNQGTIRLKSN